MTTHERAPAAPPAAGARASGPSARGSSTLRRVLAVLFPAGLLYLLFFVEVPLCPVKRLFGVPCPGCGLTRATGSLLSLDFRAMWELHPLAPVAAPLVAWVLLRATLVNLGVWRSDQYDALKRVPNAVWWVFVVALVGLWIARLALGTHPDPIAPETGWLSRWFT